MKTKVKYKQKKRKHLFVKEGVTSLPAYQINNNYKIIHGDCLKLLSEKEILQKIDLTFLDPPFNQDKKYSLWNDELPQGKYWHIMKDVCKNVFEITSNGGAIYFMQREKNAEFVLQCFRETGWTLQNLIIWKKKTSAVPCSNKYGKNYQIIGFATKGDRPRIFNRLRVSPPLPPNYKYERENGVYITDVWDDIRELTSGYFAGDEAIRKENGERFHKQQSPIALLLRIILSSTKIGDTVFDPFAGTGTTLVVSEQLERKSIGIEIDPQNVKQIKHRLEEMNGADNIKKFCKEYIYTENLNEIWHVNSAHAVRRKEELSLFNL